MSFVDIHSHILYDLDDGPRTLDQSVAMLELAAASGTTDIVATPHASGRFEFQPELVGERIAALRDRVAIRIHRGCDLHLHFDNIQDAIKHPSKYSINGRAYLLVEFPEFGIFSHTDDILAQLVDADLAPIITHPERNTELRRHDADLARWVQSGCYVQVTAGSCTGSFGRQAKAAAERLIESRLVHFVASDAHDCTHRPPVLSDAYTRLADSFGEERIRPMFVENPRAVLTGEPIDVELPRPGARRRRWYRFWSG